eukprot:6706306-Pyramimonas_sp.AAC.1
MLSGPPAATATARLLFRRGTLRLLGKALTLRCGPGASREAAAERLAVGGRLRAGTSSPGVDYRPANGSLSTGNICRIFDGIFEMPCAE